MHSSPTSIYFTFSEKLATLTEMAATCANHQQAKNNSSASLKLIGC